MIEGSPFASPHSPEPPDRRSVSDAVDLAEFRSTMREADAEDSIDEILDLFIANVPECLAALSAAMESGDARAIEQAAHAFKSPAGTIGAPGLERMLLAIELAGRSGTVESAGVTFEEVRLEAESVLQYLRSERGG